MLLDDVLASHLPTSRVPRLHAILLESGAARVLCSLPCTLCPFLHCLRAIDYLWGRPSDTALLSAISPPGTPAAATAAAPVLPPSPAVSEARARALGFLSQVLGGDELAAEYLLLQLVGRCASVFALRSFRPHQLLVPVPYAHSDRLPVPPPQTSAAASLFNCVAGCTCVLPSRLWAPSV